MIRRSPVGGAKPLKANRERLSPKLPYMLWRPICIASTRSLVEVAVKPFDQKTDIARSSTSSRSNSLGLAMDGRLPLYGLMCQ